MSLPGSDERLPLLDRLRGFTILGILVANIPWYSQPISDNWTPRAPTDWWADQLADMIVLVFVDGKMVTLLTVLFGAGLALQAEKAAAAGREFAPAYLRRQALLFAIGLGHGILLWYGDILTAYAAVGCLALFFLGLRPQRMLAIGAVFWVGLIAVTGGVAAMKGLLLSGETEEPGGVEAVMPFDPEAGAEDEDSAAAMVEEVWVYRSGSFVEMMEHRAIHVAQFLVACVVFIGWEILAGFLVGIGLYRLGWFHEPGEHRGRWVRLVAWGLGLGIPVHLLAAVAALEDREVESMLFQYLGIPFMAAAYLGIIALWTARDVRSPLARGVTAVGRTALSNYLGQSVVCGLIFYSYGLGLFGVLGRVENTIWIALLWSLELPLSVWWIERFRQGPVEWVWRSLAAGRALPFRNSQG